MTAMCSCGKYPHGAPGHDGDPARGREAEQAAAAIAAARTGQELVEGIIRRKAAELPAPWERHGKGTARQPYWYRPCDGLAAGLIEALAQLPPETAIETSTGPEMTGTPDGLWYYPHLGYVTI